MLFSELQHLVFQEQFVSAMLQHHIKQDVCTERPKYRQGRKLTAVKVYTINDESVYLLVQGVPSLNLTTELYAACSEYGTVKTCRPVTDYPDKEKFTEVYVIQYEKINNARYAKRKLDDISFYGGVLHVCYAPEYETVEETRSKLRERRKTVEFRIRKLREEREEETKDKKMRITKRSNAQLHLGAAADRKASIRPFEKPKQSDYATPNSPPLSSKLHNDSQSAFSIGGLPLKAPAETSPQPNAAPYPSMDPDCYRGGSSTSTLPPYLKDEVVHSQSPQSSASMIQTESSDSLVHRSRKRPAHQALESGSWHQSYNLVKKSSIATIPDEGDKSENPDAVDLCSFIDSPSELTNSSNSGQPPVSTSKLGYNTGAGVQWKPSISQPDLTSNIIVREYITARPSSQTRFVLRR